MTVKHFVDGLMAQYPESLHPPQDAIKDMVRVLRKLNYSDRQMQDLYDKVIFNCSFFPRINDLITAASDLAYRISTNKQPEVSWETFHDSEGRIYAKKRGLIQHEKAEDELRRLKREACSVEEGLEAFREAFLQAGGNPAMLLDMKRCVTSKDRSEISDYDDSNYALESSWEDI